MNPCNENYAGVPALTPAAPALATTVWPRRYDVSVPVGVGLTYRTRTGRQAYRVVRVLGGDHFEVEKLNGVYAGNLELHRVTYRRPGFHMA